MSNTREWEIIDNLVNALLAVTGNVDWVVQKLEETGLAQDEIRKLGFDI